MPLFVKTACMRKPIFLLFALILFAFLFAPITACKKVKKDDAWSATVARYLYAHTSGITGRTDAIRVRFAQPAVGQDQVGKPVAKSVFNVKPTIAGEAVWEDASTIKLQPTEPLPYDAKYEATVGIGTLFKDAPKEVSDFSFAFRVRTLAFEVEVDGFQAPDPQKRDVQQIHGTVYTSDAVDATVLERTLNARQGNQERSIGWTHATDGLSHRFYVNDVTRGAVRSKVMLEWSGKPLGLATKGDTEVTVPALDEFVPLSARVQQREGTSVRINFSDPVSTDQPLQGLIGLENYNGALRYAVEGNFVNVFVESGLTGSHPLYVEPGVRNVAGAATGGRTVWPLNFEQNKPALRLVGRGVIIPSTDEGAIIFPFEAVGLEAVDVEIFKIYQSNILQFLQVNDIEGTQELERVGKIIWQQKVDLQTLNPAATASAWHRYGLDLRNLIQRDPNAIYQVRLAFRRGYTTTRCAQDPDKAEDALAQLGQTDEDGQLVSIMGGYQGIYYNAEEYYEEYEWGERDNPCRREYYNSDHYLSRNVFVSDLGLVAKQGRDGSVFVAVTDLRTARPVGSTDLEYFNYQLQSIGKSKTDGEGTLTIENLPEKPFIVVATQGNRRGYVRMADGASLSLSRFDVAGVESQKGLKGYLYGERGVWRPGDSLFLNFVLEDQAGTLPTGHPVSFQLTDPKGTVQYRTVSTQSVGGVYPLHCATRPDAPTGNWVAEVKVGGATFTRPIKVETVKPNRLKLDLNFGKKALYAADQNLTGNLQVNWLHGAPARQLRAKVETTVRATPTTFANYKDFVFDDPARSFESEPQVLFEGTLNDNGAATVPLHLPDNTIAPGKLIANFRVRAFEAGGDFSTDNFALDYFPYERFVGVSIPTNRWGSKEISKDGGTLQFVVVDKDGRPLANQTIDVGLYRCSWRWWWDEDSRANVAQFNSAQHTNALQRTRLTTDGRGLATWKVSTSEWGRYLVRIADVNGGHAAGDFFWTGYPDSEDNMAGRNAAAMLVFATDKEKYNVGDEVTLKVPASEDGKILVTLENGTKVVERRWYDAKAGDNLLKFRTDERMAPTVYAHVNLLQPHAQTKNNLPVRMYGITPVNVENPVTHLTPQLEMPEVLEPGKAFNVNLRETSGKACTYTLAIVDEGLLDLTRFETPDPWKTFYAREALGVKTWDVYDHVLGAYGTTLERLLSVGGDGINQKARSAAQVNRFKPVVRHLGPFTLAKGKTAHHTITLDNYVGSVRVMAVCAAPAAAKKGAYGMAEKTCPVRKPLMILPTLPRVLGPGETLRLPIEVFAMENKVKNATIRVREAAGLVSVGGGNTNLTFAQPGNQLAYVDLKVGNRTGTAKFDIEAQGGGERVTETIEIAVRAPNPTTTLVWDGAVEAGQTWEGGMDASKFASIESAMLEVSALPAINLQRHLSYLLRYPHGCVEQITSGAFPQLYVDALTPLTDAQKQQAAQNIGATIARLQQFQQAEGGFGYWPGASQADDWASSYVGHFLAEAKGKGHPLPEGMMDRWTTYQANKARTWSAPTQQAPWLDYESNLAQAYRLYTLALVGKPDLAGMNRLRESKTLYQQSANLLAAAYARAGKAEVARNLLQQSWRNDWQYEWSGYTYGSELRDRALMLETYVTIGDDNKTNELVQFVCNQLGGPPQWSWTTQSLATALRALSYYVGKKGSATPNYTWYAANGKSQKGSSAKAFSTADLTAAAQSGATTVRVQNNGSGRQYVRLVVQGQPVPGAETAEQQNIALNVRYVDTKGNAVDVGRLKQGTDFVAEITVKRDGTLSYPFNELALSQLFPSGWEILNSRMQGGMGGPVGSQMDYQDIRDDRVYTYFDLNNKNDVRTYRVLLNAAYAGRYYLPATNCEAMYDNRIRARTTGRWVEVL